MAGFIIRAGIILSLSHRFDFGGHSS
jgi:hypothetical protein